MARESPAARKTRAALIFEGLRRTYPDAHCELLYSNPLELLVATILSAQCTDKLVNQVTPALFQKYRSAADYARAPQEVLEGDIKRIGLYRSKAKNIRSACATLVELHGGEVPNKIESLIALAGVGRKTANVVLGNAFGLNEGVVVDTHVARLSDRLELSREKDPLKIEKDLMTLAPREHWTLLSHWLIWHGRRRCPARHPQCEQCEILVHCPLGRKSAHA